MSRKLFLLLFCGLVFNGCEGRFSRATKRSFKPTRSKYFELSILHINNFYDRFLKTSPSSSSNSLKNEEFANNSTGSLARLVTASHKLLKERPNAIFLDVGDHFSGKFWHNAHRWHAIVNLLNMLPLDAVTLGNHDFDNDVSRIVPYLKRVNATVVVTNIQSNRNLTLQGCHRNSTIIKRGNQKIGIIGLVGNSSDPIYRNQEMKFSNEIKAVSVEATKLKIKGANIIIVLSNSGAEMDKIIAANATNVDIIIGKAPPTDKPEDAHPAVVVVKQKPTGRSVLVVPAVPSSKYLGNLTVWFDRRGEVVEWEGNRVLLNNSFEKNPKALEEIKSWEDENEKINLAKVGETKVFLDNSCSSRDCNLANLVTDAMVYGYQNKSDDPNPWTYAAISCISTSGIRDSIPIGDITYGKLISVLPFANTWDLIDLKGEDLYDALEESVSHSAKNESFDSSSFLHWAGVNVTYDLSRPAFSRIVTVQVRCQECSEPEYEDLQKNKTYRVIVPSDLLINNDSMTIANRHLDRRIGKLDVALMIDYLNKTSPIDYEPEPRIVLLGERSD